jgi:hypothetical protein
MQARFMIPMAVSLAFGVLFASFITLFLVPCSYLMLEDFLALFARATPEPKTPRPKAVRDRAA